MPPWLRIVATTRNDPDVLSRLPGLDAAELDAHDENNLRDLRADALQRLTQEALCSKLAGQAAEQVAGALLEASAAASSLRVPRCAARCSTVPLPPLSAS